MVSWFVGVVIALVLAVKVLAIAGLILGCIAIWAIFRLLFRAAGTVSPFGSKHRARVVEPSVAPAPRPVCRYDEVRQVPQVVLATSAVSSNRSSRRGGSPWWVFWGVFALVAVVILVGVRSRRERESVNYRFAAPAAERVRNVPTTKEDRRSDRRKTPAVPTTKEERRADKRPTAPTTTVAVIEKPSMPPNPSWTVVGTGETLDNAKEDACTKAWEKLVEFLREHEPSLEWTPSVGFVRKNFATHWGSEENAHLEGVGPVMQVPLYVELTPAKGELIVEQDKQFRVENRMNHLLKIFGGLVVLLAAVAGYMRLDEWSKGYYTGVLRVAAVIFIVASAAGMWFVVRH